MKLKVQTLLEIIDGANANIDKHNAAYIEAKKSWQEEQWQNWLDDNLPKWAKFQTLLKDCVQKRKPVTRELIQECFGKSNFGYSGYFPYWAGTQDTVSFKYKGNDWSPYKPIPEYLHLRRLLTSVEDEYITTSALKEMGFRNLEALFRKAAETNGQAKG